MGERASLTGGCLCGAVRFRAEGVHVNFSACHCEMCRRWGSGPYLSTGVDAIAFEAEAPVARYRSSDWAERGFCAKCGTNLFYRLVEADHYIVSISTFDDQERWRMSGQIFIDEKPGYYDLANQTKMMTGAEVFEAFAKGEFEE